MNRIMLFIMLAIITIVGVDHTWAVERFPPPDFSGGHVVPATTPPAFTARSSGWIDVAALTMGLAVASWLSLKKRSRLGVVALSIASLAYFGFWRRGCVCAIGSIQNIAQGVADSNVAVPLVVIAFFTLPLIVSLIWGRSFCAGVCPHGAIQDLVLIKPIKVPTWLDEILRVMPWLHLAITVLFAATGSLFILCKFDPFVSIFRMAGPMSMWVTGGILLVISMFVGRPYCRYICPYGALLGAASRCAKWRPSVTPDTCTRCRLCESACPFGALNSPIPKKHAVAQIAAGRRKIILLVILLPLLGMVFGWLGGKAGVAALPIHPDGKLAALVLAQDRGEITTPLPDELTAFHKHGANIEPTFTKARTLETNFLTIGRLLGAAFGIAMTLKLIRILFPPSSDDYETDHGRCLSCARCYDSCPYELARKGIHITIPGQGGVHE